MSEDKKKRIRWVQDLPCMFDLEPAYRYGSRGKVPYDDYEVCIVPAEQRDEVFRYVELMAGTRFSKYSRVWLEQSGFRKHRYYCYLDVLSSLVFERMIEMGVDYDEIE